MGAITNPKPRITAPFRLLVTYAKSSCIFEGMVVMVLSTFLSKTVIKKKKEKKYYCSIVSKLEWLFPLSFIIFLCVKEGISNICLTLSGSHVEIPYLFWRSPSWDSLPTGVCFWAPITLLVTSSSSSSTPLWWMMKKGHSFSIPRKKWSSNWRTIIYLLLLAVDIRVKLLR